MAKNSGPNPRSFPKIINKTPPGGQNLAQKRVFTPLFRLHTALNAFRLVVFGMLVWSSIELATLFQTVLGTPKLRAKGITTNILAPDWITLTVARASSGRKLSPSSSPTSAITMRWNPFSRIHCLRGIPCVALPPRSLTFSLSYARSTWTTYTTSTKHASYTTVASKSKTCSSISATFSTRSRLPRVTPHTSYSSRMLLNVGLAQLPSRAVHTLNGWPRNTLKSRSLHILRRSTAHRVTTSS